MKNFIFLFNAASFTSNYVRVFIFHTKLVTDIYASLGNLRRTIYLPSHFCYLYFLRKIHLFSSLVLKFSMSTVPVQM